MLWAFPVSSMECGRRISNAIVRRFGGSYSKSQKLYGRKDGRNVYRISFSVRMPGFRVGDVLEIGDKRISIEKMVEGRGIEGVDIDTGERVFLSKRETVKAKRVWKAAKISKWFCIGIAPFYNHAITQIFTNLFLKRKALPKELFCFFFVYKVYFLPPSTQRAPSSFPQCALWSLWLSLLIFLFIFGSS